MTGNTIGTMEVLWTSLDDGGRWIDYFKFSEEIGEKLVGSLPKTEEEERYDSTISSLNTCTPRWLLDEPPVIDNREWDIVKRVEVVEEHIEDKISLPDFVQLCYEDGISDTVEIIEKYKGFFG